MGQRDASAEFLDKLRRRTASLAIGASTLRNQGASGVVSAARSALARLQLAEFHVSTKDEFLDVLDRQKSHIEESLPPEGRSWGAARKALNIYLRDVIYNAALRDHFKLKVIRDWLEVPLDSYVARGVRKGLSEKASGEPLTRWPGVKKLTRDISQEYQSKASAIARHLGVARVDLDVLYWRND